MGRNVLHGRWSFQIVEEYDDAYYAAFRDLEREARDELVGGRRHLFEAEMKEYAAPLRRPPSTRPCRTTPGPRVSKTGRGRGADPLG